MPCNIIHIFIHLRHSCHNFCEGTCDTKSQVQNSPEHTTLNIFIPAPGHINKQKTPGHRNLLQQHSEAKKITNNNILQQEFNYDVQLQDIQAASTTVNFDQLPRQRLICIQFFRRPCRLHSLSKSPYNLNIFIHCINCQHLYNIDAMNSSESPSNLTQLLLLAANSQIEKDVRVYQRGSHSGTDDNVSVLVLQAAPRKC